MEIVIPLLQNQFFKSKNKNEAIGDSGNIQKARFSEIRVHGNLSFIATLKQYFINQYLIFIKSKQEFTKKHLKLFDNPVIFATEINTKPICNIFDLKSGQNYCIKILVTLFLFHVPIFIKVGCVQTQFNYGTDGMS